MIEPPRRRRVNLEVKAVVALLVISAVPLVISAVLIDQTGKVAHNFASNEAAFLREPLEKAQDAYRELIETKRELYYRQAALRVAAMPEIAAIAYRPAATDDAPARTPGSPPTRGDDATGLALLAVLLAELPELHHLAVIAPDGRRVAERERLLPVGVELPAWRPLTIEQPVPRPEDMGAPDDADSARVALTFAASLELQQDYLALGRALRGAQRIDEVRSALPTSYRNAFWVLVGGVVLVVTATGIILARRLTRRIEALVSGTREVAAGDLAARVTVRGTDELAELGWAFNRMVEDLERDRDQIAYLQKMGAWQDVARKLAHEIKNPLTPIQLAVQQCVSSYRGDDERHRRMLRDTEEIVTEEISSLRRLVDAFRALGQLPRVEPVPIDVAVVVDDLTKDPMLADKLAVEPPAGDVEVRGDRMLLRRVLTNLVENGIHAGAAAGDDGAVTIGWRADNTRGRAIITVDDRGAGVPENRREAIFEPYVTSKDEGTGLGLAISKKIALEHGGSLTVSATPAPTGGARFVLALPLVRPSD